MVTTFQRCAVVLTLLAAYACSGESPTAPVPANQPPPAVTPGSPPPSNSSAQEADRDIALSSADVISGALTALYADAVAAGMTFSASLAPSGSTLNTSTDGESGTTGGTTGGTPEGNKPPHEGCTFSTVTQLYSCPSNVTESFSVTRSFGYFNAAGAAMPAFIRGTTASIRLVVKTDARTVRDTTYTSATHSLRDHILSGLLTDKRIWDGTGSSADTNSHREGQSVRLYTGTSVDTTRAVTFEAEKSKNKYPLSGSSIRVVNYTKTQSGKESVTVTVNRRVVVTYNGTNKVPMQVGNVSCTLNLDTRKPEGC